MIRKYIEIRICRHISTRGLGLLVFCFLAACSNDEMPGNSSEIDLEPAFYTGTPDTRSIVTGTASATAEGKIHEVEIYVTQDADNSIYPVSNNQTGLSKFSYDGTKWTGIPVVKLSNIVARIYAFYPVDAAVTPGATQSENHTIPVTVQASQTFTDDDSRHWNCSMTDYLYGSASGTPGVAESITASNTGDNYKPSIHLQHALAQVVFNMQSASGRAVDNTYDFVKKIEFKATGNLFQTGTGNMLLKDGTLESLSTDTNVLTFSPSAENRALLCGANSNPAIVGYGLVCPLKEIPTPGSVTITLVLGKEGDTANDRELSQTLSNPQWKKGNRYIYNLTLSDRAITVKIDETPIKDWSLESGTGSLYPDGFK